MRRWIWIVALGARRMWRAERRRRGRPAAEPEVVRVMDDPQLTVPYHWEHVEERDRGYDTPCWVDVAPFDSYRHRRRLLHALVGETGRANGTCLMHLCEVYGEKNRCIRPDHVRIATMSENVKHSYELRRAAGQPRRLSAEHRAKIGASMVGKPSRNKEGKNQW